MNQIFKKIPTNIFFFKKNQLYNSWFTKFQTTFKNFLSSNFYYTDNCNQNNSVNKHFIIATHSYHPNDKTSHIP